MSEAPEADLSRVEWRVQGKIDSGGGVRVVAYLDGVYVAELLDGWVGNTNWYDRYEPGHGKGLWCHLTLRIGDEWITKVDLGVPSQQESDKGLVSDAFKRVAMRKWRVGHNIYALPIIRLQRGEFREHDGKAYLNGSSRKAIDDHLAQAGFESVGQVAEDEPEPAPANGNGRANGTTSPKALVIQKLQDERIDLQSFADFLGAQYGVEKFDELAEEDRTQVVYGITQGDLVSKLREGASA